MPALLRPRNALRRGRALTLAALASCACPLAAAETVSRTVEVADGGCADAIAVLRTTLVAAADNACPIGKAAIPSDGAAGPDGVEVTDCTETPTALVRARAEGRLTYLCE